MLWASLPLKSVNTVLHVEPCYFDFTGVLYVELFCDPQNKILSEKELQKLNLEKSTSSLKLVGSFY